MKFEISTQEFNYLIGKCLNVVSQKAAVPILSNLLLEAYNGILSITATDLIVSIRCFMEAKITEEGATTLPAKRLAQLVRELTSVTTEVHTNARDITEIRADGSRFRLNGMSKGEFPTLPDLSGAVRFTMKQIDLHEVLYRTAFAVSREDNRFALTGVCLNIANSVATFIGTDGKRMARTFIPVSTEPSFRGSYIIPLKAIEEAQKNLTMDDSEATIYLMDDKVAIETTDSTIVTKLLSGQYPEVQKVIPDTTEIAVTLHREELMALLRQVALFTAEGNQAARFSFSNGELKLDAATCDVGEGNTSMPVNYHGPKLDIAFNPNYFIDILRHSKQETVTLGLSDAHNPGMITDETMSKFVTADASPLFVLMPMRLNEECI